jgi:hypothetical protein
MKAKGAMHRDDLRRSGHGSTPRVFCPPSMMLAAARQEDAYAALIFAPH